MIRRTEHLQYVLMDASVSMAWTFIMHSSRSEAKVQASSAEELRYLALPCANLEIVYLCLFWSGFAFSMLVWLSGNKQYVKYGLAGSVMGGLGWVLLRVIDLNF